MKSSLIDKNIDSSLEIQGESWVQGQELKGQLKLLNKSLTVQKLDTQKLLLAYVDIKKFKALEDKCYQVLATINLGEVSLKPSETLTLPWSYQLEENSPITDKKHSLYILWGDLSKKIPPSLMLNILPHPSIQKILELWEIFFRFTRKEILSLKDQTLEVKLEPPTAREYATLDYLKLRLKRSKGDLNFHVIASIQSIAADTTGMKLTKSEKKQEAIWKEKNYQLMPGHLNQEFVQNNINTLLNSIMNRK